MPTIDETIAAVIDRETGGLPFAASPATLDAADRGGWTRGGITAVNAGAFLGLWRPATEAELNALTEAQAFAFYRQYGGPYWVVYEPLRAMLYDFSVTSGAAAAKALQTGLVRQKVYLRADGSIATIDGVIGALTVAALARPHDKGQLYRECFEAMIRHYMFCVVSDSRIPASVKQTTNIRFGSGWMNRALGHTPRS